MFAVHRVQQHGLFRCGEVGQFDSGVECNLFVIDHIQEWQHKLCEANEAVNLIAAITSLLPNNIKGLQLHPNLG